MIDGMINCSIVKRAQDKNLAEIHLHNLRDYTTDKWRRVDDYPLAVKPEWSCRSNRSTGLYLH